MSKLVAAFALTAFAVAASCAGKTPEPETKTTEPGAGPSAVPFDGGDSEIGEPLSTADGGPSEAVEAADAGSPRAAGASLRDAGTAGATSAPRDAGTSTATTAPRDAGTPPSGTTGTGARTVAEPDKKTARLWKSKCASCHGDDGRAGTKNGREMKIRDMTTRQYQSKSDADFRKAIEKGAKSDSGEMPGFEDELSREQIDALVKYVRWVAEAP